MSFSRRLASDQRHALPIFLATNIDRDEDPAKWLLNSDAGTCHRTF
jgi:hypothetical protein